MPEFRFVNLQANSPQTLVKEGDMDLQIIEPTGEQQNKTRRSRKRATGTKEELQAAGRWDSDLGKLHIRVNKLRLGHLNTATFHVHKQQTT